VEEVNKLKEMLEIREVKIDLEKKSFFYDKIPDP